MNIPFLRPAMAAEVAVRGMALLAAVEGEVQVTATRR